MKLTRTLFFGVLVVGVLAATAGTIADEPVKLAQFCMTKADRAQMAAARVSCDELAEKYGYVHGVVRPRNPSDDDEIILCERSGMESVESVADLYFCEGVGGR